MVNAACRELRLLLEASRILLDCADPSLEAWGDYATKRNELFQRLQLLMPLAAESEPDLNNNLQSLLATTLEMDELLRQKIQRHLSNFRRDMMAVGTRRRLFTAYAAGSPASVSIHRCNA
jgi:hypothetical protein